MDELRATTVDTPIGTLTLVATDAGLREIRWPGSPPTVVPARTAPVLDQAAEELTDYFGGRLRRFDVPLDLVGTPFQLRHWASLAAIPYGTTTTYGDLAVRQGNVRRARAIGAANGANPVPIVLPCHRVVGTDGSLAGFGGGLEVKRLLLDHESRHR
ncbi:MAG: methylated-DNA--[protein]-cysteine S-methyltransferase [Acidimicrobiia bacterium]|nr:methylated-DNA--[protein]-cysteine S-methyltransferase [Acidimicrobiia bacterium]